MGQIRQHPQLRAVLLLLAATLAVTAGQTTVTDGPTTATTMVTTAATTQPTTTTTPGLDAISTDGSFTMVTMETDGTTDVDTTEVATTLQTTVMTTPDPCDSVTCENGGMCNDGNCACVDGWYGTTCIEEYCDVNQGVCENGGICRNNHAASPYYSCDCPDNWDGTNCTSACEQNVKFGQDCLEDCTCVESATCNSINGRCDCVPAFPGASCYKTELTVEAKVEESMISEADNFTLNCTINLPDEDVSVELLFMGKNLLVANESTKYQVSESSEGMYVVVVLNAQAQDSGDYVCRATTTLLSGNRVVENSTATVDVLVTGRIVDEQSTRESRVRLNDTAVLNCTVFSSDMAFVGWERNGTALQDGDNYTITTNTRPQPGGAYFSSQLSVMNIVREDNGTYVCIASDADGIVTDSGYFHIIVEEAPELANSRYSNVQSTQLDLEWDVMFYGNLFITSCTATYSSSPGGEQVVMLGATSPQTVVNLTEYTEYNFTLMCRNSVGDSLPLVYPEQRTFAGAPSAPGNVIVQNPTQTTIDVSWTEPAEPRGPINGYLITATPGGDPFNFTSRALNHTLEGLTPGSLYIIVVQAYNIEGTNGVEVGAESPPSGTIKTLDARPGPPFNLQIMDNPDSCVVRWEVPREPNGVITGYTLYYQAIGRSSGVLNIEERVDKEGTVHEWERQKSRLHDYSNFLFAVVAKTSVGMGLENATSEETCQTEVGEPVEPPALPTPSPEDITKISFAITMPEFDESNGPHSCYEVIVIQLADPEAELFPPSLEDTENYSEDIKPGIPYRAVMLEEIPPNRMVTIGDQMKKETRCNTGRNPGPQARRKRSTTNADDLTAVNGPLRAGSYYSTLVRVYSPDSANPSLVYYETGDFSPVVSTTPEGPNVGAIVGGIFAAIIIVALVAVAFLYLRKRDSETESHGQLMPNGRDQTNGSVPMVNLGIDEVDEMIVKPIPLQNLEKEIRRKSQEERKIFWAEYKALPNKTPAMVTVHASNHPANKEKNRYINIIAYDHTRVKLRTIDSIEGSDYINASYVNGYESPDKFIAAQGPKENTVDDFWRMIWEQNCSTIVMLTKCVEDGRDKCYQYWPSKGTMKCGKLLVTMDNVQQTAEYVIRSLVLQEDGKDNQRSITQFHFLGWPDHGQPDYPSPMLCLIKRVRHLTSKINKRANIVVHCSAGVGRTGTYIVIDAMMDMMKREKKVDIYNFIYEIRQQRNTLVQSFIQYFFIHMALLEEYMFGHTDISVQAVPEYYANLGKASQVDEHLSNLELEFRRAARLPVNKVEQKFANVEANKEKNRIGHILPYDKNVVKLERLIGVEYSDYINASYITGYQRKEMYIATQGPLTNTIGDFWRMVWASETSTIVMLTEISQRGQEMCAQYWPVEDGEEVQHGDIAVKLEGEEEEDVFTIRNISISQSQVSQLIYDNVDNEESEETEALYGNVPKTTTKDVRYIRQFHYRDWPEVGVPESGLDLIKLVNKAHLHQSEHGPHPIVVHCSAGAGRTGVFLALSILMERMEKETMVDVFQTVRSLRQQRPHMVQDLAQYKFCYSALTEYIQDQSTEYQNFVPREV